MSISYPINLHTYILNCEHTLRFIIYTYNIPRQTETDINYDSIFKVLEKYYKLKEDECTYPFNKF